MREVTPDSPADRAGIRAGDYLVRVGTIEVRDASFGERFRAQYGTAQEGTLIAVVARRGKETMTLDVPLRFEKTLHYAIATDPAPSAKAARIRDGIVRGTLSP